MMSVGENPRHRRSVSTGSGRRSEKIAPVPPPRSAPTTCRRPRRHVGDRVFVSSPTKVYLDYVDDNLKVAMERIAPEEEEEEDFDEESVGEMIRTSKDIPKIRSRIFEDSLESQEISFYIGQGERKADCSARCENINRRGGDSVQLISSINSMQGFYSSEKNDLRLAVFYVSAVTSKTCTINVSRLLGIKLCKVPYMAI